MSIYKLFHEQAPDRFYIGSTHRPLSYRLSAHKNDYLQFLRGRRAYLTSFDIVSQGPFPGLKIELLEAIPDGVNIKEREAFYIHQAQQNGGNITNHNIPGRDPRRYYQDNKETILNTLKQYYQQHRDRILKKANERNRLKRVAKINIQVNINAD